MNLAQLVHIVGDEPVFETGLLLAGDVDPAMCAASCRAGHGQEKCFSCVGASTHLRPLSKVKPHPFVVANRMVRSSYVSCESALAYYGLIPEYAPTVVSVTPSRPGRWQTALGGFIFHHLKVSFWRGYRLTKLVGSQQAFIATPEKALLDLIYLRPGADSYEFLSELRLQNLERIDLTAILQWATELDSPKLNRAVMHITQLARLEETMYEVL
ncbi:MAG: hypothetical protein IPK16_10345 [Anaerolineales bacterium]|nr:hypothetical protein [Anaerolineales bacterium]